MSTDINKELSEGKRETYPYPMSVAIDALAQQNTRLLDIIANVIQYLIKRVPEPDVVAPLLTTFAEAIKHPKNES